MNITSPVPGFSALGMVSIVLLLAGCSAYDAAAHGRVQTSFTHETEFAQEHPDSATWLPADATSITVANSTRAEHTMTIRYDSTTTPVGCESAPRESSPTMGVYSGIDVYSIDSVLVCDGWAVAHGDGQWIAWIPATEAR